MCDITFLDLMCSCLSCSTHPSTPFRNSAFIFLSFPIPPPSSSFLFRVLCGPTYQAPIHLFVFATDPDRCSISDGRQGPEKSIGRDEEPGRNGRRVSGVQFKARKSQVVRSKLVVNLIRPPIHQVILPPSVRFGRRSQSQSEGTLRGFHGADPFLFFSVTVPLTRDEECEREFRWLEDPDHSSNEGLEVRDGMCFVGGEGG